MRLGMVNAQQPTSRRAPVTFSPQSQSRNGMPKTTTSPAQTLAFPLLGRSLHARLHSPALAGWLNERWHFPEHNAPGHPYRIGLTETFGRPATLPDPTGTPVTAELPGITLQWWHHERCWQTGGPEAGVAVYFEPEGARIEVWSAGGSGLVANSGHDPAPGPNTGSATPEGTGATTPHHSLYPALYPALYLALNEALRASGLIPLHAAILTRDGLATALVAPSGTGKSTTLLRAIAAGYTPLAEDLSWLDPETFTIYGWDRGIRLWPATIERLLPQLADAPWTTDADGKLFLEYSVLGAPRHPMAMLKSVIRLERDRNRPGAESGTLRPLCDPAQPSPRLAPLDPYTAVRTLWEATGVPLLPTTRATLARQIPGLLRGLELSRLDLDS